MLLKEIFLKTKYILQGKRAALIFYALFLMVTLNFIENVTEFRGLDKLQMYHPMKMLLLSYNKTNYRADLVNFINTIIPFFGLHTRGIYNSTGKAAGSRHICNFQTGKEKIFFSKLSVCVCCDKPYFYNSFFN